MANDMITKIGFVPRAMGIAGGAILPQIYVHRSPIIYPQTAFFWSMLPGGLYILYYATKGYPVGCSSA
jgi:FHS family L-fucose permease-like MFS transporter